MSEYYTGKGDGGYSSLIGGKPMDKDGALFDILGDMDELNCFIAVSLLYVKDAKIKNDLETIQDNIFSISAVLASSYSKQNTNKIALPEASFLEESIKNMDKDLPPLKKFVIPGGSEASSYLHVARAVARRVERELVTLNRIEKIDPAILRYSNRLSSFLFVAALHLNHNAGVEEKNPKYS